MPREQIGHYDTLVAQVLSTYDMDVVTEHISSIRSVSCFLACHQELVRDILAAGSVEAAEKIPEVGHPYSLGYWAHVKSDMTWSEMLGYRAKNILDMRDNGIKTSIELFCDDEGIYLHGHHRLAVAVELGLPTLPARVHCTSSNLATLAEKTFSIYKGKQQFSLYQPINHPFFRLFPVQTANSAWDRKVEVITRVTADWTGEIIEVGAHFGMLTRALRSTGLDIRATDLIKGYLDYQPLFEGIGLDPIPYECKGIQHLTEKKSPVRLVIMGLMHHLVGKPELWSLMQLKVLPWMTKWVEAMVVEMSLVPQYLGGRAAVSLTSDSEIEAFWQRYGFTSTRLLVGSMRRVTYLIERNKGTTKAGTSKAAASKEEVAKAKPPPAMTRKEAMHYVGAGSVEEWEQATQLQFDLLILHGMTPQSSVLEIGAGTLALARKLVAFLDVGNYTGIEPTTAVTDAVEPLDAAQEPVLLTNRTFDPSKADRTFDIVFAHSVLTHTAPWQFGFFLRHVRPHLRPGGSILASIRWGEDTNAATWVYPKAVWFSLAAVEKRAETEGYHVEPRADLREHCESRLGRMFHDWVVFTLA